MINNDFNNFSRKLNPQYANSNNYNASPKYNEEVNQIKFKDEGGDVFVSNEPTEKSNGKGKKKESLGSKLKKFVKEWALNYAQTNTQSPHELSTIGSSAYNISWNLANGKEWHGGNKKS